MSRLNRVRGKLALSGFGQLDTLDRWVFPFAEVLVPAPKRPDWIQEWRAELWHLRHGERRCRWEHGELLETISLAHGLIADAAWLRWDWLKESARGSAAWCLTMLVFYCLVCAAMERTLASSWHSFFHVLAAHFFGSFVFVAVPAVFVAISTYPLRPLRCDDKHVRAGGFLSARARWNLFLGAKVVLTLALGFLSTIVATAPVGMAIRRFAPWGLDWAELLMSALVVTVGLRWALLNQERRCQRCLRVMGQPTRVGPPSRNFLDWSGMELVCADGHGRLHVPEMQGSWCWYDRWVELDPAWQSLFGA
jgi:hypothetical protein